MKIEAVYDGACPALLPAAGRLDYVNLYVGTQPENPQGEGEAPGSYLRLTKYTYDENSQISTHKVNADQFTTAYTYNNRNWVNWTTQSPGTIFRYVLLYNANGTIRYQDLQGSYSDNFGVTGSRRNVFTYDKSNRLVKANEILAADSNTYDIITLTITPTGLLKLILIHLQRHLITLLPMIKTGISRF